MKAATTFPISSGTQSTELLLLPDGNILVHNLTPAMAALLANLNPADQWMRERAAAIAKNPVDTNTEPETRK